MTQYVPGVPKHVTHVQAVGPKWTEIPPMPEAVADARRVVREALTPGDPECIYDAELIASELTTNAIRCVRAEGRPPCEVEPGIWIQVQDHPRWAHLLVRDPCPAVLPTKKQATTTDTDGRGLLISAAIAALLWVELGDTDKIVHAVITKPGVTLTETEIAGLRG